MILHRPGASHHDCFFYLFEKKDFQTLVGLERISYFYGLVLAQITF